MSFKIETIGAICEALFQAKKWASLLAIRDKTGLNIKTVRRYINHLNEKGIVRKETRRLIIGATLTLKGSRVIAPYRALKESFIK